MATNLHPRFLLCATIAGLVATAPGSVAGPLSPPCPPEAATLVAEGWRAYRADSMTSAAARFAAADSLCEANLDAKVGRGYAALRLGRTAEADSLFTVVVEADSTNGDGWDGLTLTRYRAGNTAAALRAARRAIVLHPDNTATSDILTGLDPDWQRGPRPGTPRRPATLRVDARVQGDFFEIPAGKGWRRFYINGVNMGVALPGKFPSEFPQDSALYAGWLDTMARMHANTLRLYTILPPAFYRALHGWNTTHPTQRLWLIHGVWTELPPEHDFNDPEWRGQFRAEMNRVVDLLHGRIAIPPRPGHASGRYDTDVSPWVLGYIIGREWEPYAVKEFDARHPRPTAWRGRYLTTRPGASASDIWMAEQCDYLVGYEVEHYNTIRPIAYTNWPTLDPLFHVTEATGKEETAWRKKVGRELPRDPIEYENDAIGLDAMLIRATPKNPAGWFASYHAYPYYPDFMLYDPVYDTAHSAEGRSNYFGYLRDLKRHHAGVPLLISEYGVPSSRGMAHLQPQGWNHGGHDEMAQAQIDARLTREIRQSGAAGGIIFAWIDEWFKKNWIVIDFEIPLEHTRLWHNMMDAEQNYGILGMYAGSAAPRLGGNAARQPADSAVQTNPRAQPGQPRRLWLDADASYLHVEVEFAGLAGSPFPWHDRDILIALDTYRPDRGQQSLPGGVIQGDLGFEFLARFRDSTDADLAITPEYNPYAAADVIINGDDYGRFRHRPTFPAPRTDGRFDSLFVITNRARFTRDGRFLPALGYNRGRLRYGTEAQSSLSDWYWDEARGVLQLRLAWGLLNVTDPSTRTILYEEREGDEIGTAITDGFRVGIAVVDHAGGQQRLTGALPVPVAGQWRRSQFRTWVWPTWTAPEYHARMKPVFDSLQALWSRP